MLNNENSLVQTLTNLLKNTHNLILHGAPGTGKTHLAHEIAKELGCSKNEVGFVQFHPSYDYTDFVEGLRPVKSSDGKSSIGFERKDGVFKEFCKRAVKNLTSAGDVFSNENNFSDAWKKLIEYANRKFGNKEKLKIGDMEYIDFKQGDDGKSLAFPEECSLGSITYSNVLKAYKGEIARPSGQHQKDMEDVVQYLKDNFGLEDYKTTMEKENSQKKPFLFIIDEINRGELSKIFGELFYAIEPGYRGEKGRIQTQYQNLVEESDVFKDGFFIPENVYIIGTMNDIDRSVDTMDFAFRRRFTFYEIKAEDTIEMLDEKTDENGNTTGLSAKIADEAKNRMKNLNDAISKIDGLNSSYHIGGAYFLKLNELCGDFEKLWNYHLKGLLQEYLRGRDDAETKLGELKKAYNNTVVALVETTSQSDEVSHSEQSEESADE